MADEKQQDGQKTLVAFIVGLLIGGMLVWAFSGPAANAPQNTTSVSNDESTEGTEEAANEGDSKGESVSTGSTNETKETEKAPAPKLQVGDGSIKVSDQKASDTIKIDSATYPVSEGWIGVRSYRDDNLGSILGVARFSESQGLVPTEIPLLVPTTAGNPYAVVVFTEDGDRVFNLAGDVQIDQIFDTFSAQ